MSHTDYARYTEQFTAAKYDPTEWVQLAKAAGMKYMVMCTRQHPGYSMFDSDLSDFTAAKGAPGRDLVGEYVEACRSAGMRVGFYYSLLDWRYKAYFDGPQQNPKAWAQFLEYVHGQVRELMSNYGEIDLLWYDGRWPYAAADWRADELNHMVRSLQPGILINNRSGESGDFGTPEQSVGLKDKGRPWESCFTMNDHWGYSPQDRNWKSTRQLIHLLVDCVSRGGNLLLNVGPKPDGSFPPEAVERLTEIAAWYEKNGEAITGCGRNPLSQYPMGGIEDWLLSKSGLTTAKDATVYLHILHWPGSEIHLANIGSPVRRAKMIATGEMLSFAQDGDKVTITGLPIDPPDSLSTVIALEFDETPVRVHHFRHVE
jgi:alpha-L-fucosidase